MTNDSDTNQSSGTQMNSFAQAQVIQPFNSNDDQWELYQERLENYFRVGNVKDDLKPAFLLNAVGPIPYKVIRDMCFPMKPSEKKYDELCTLGQIRMWNFRQGF